MKVLTPLTYLSQQQCDDLRVVVLTNWAVVQLIHDDPEESETQIEVWGKRTSKDMVVFDNENPRVAVIRDHRCLKKAELPPEEWEAYRAEALHLINALHFLKTERA